MTLPPIGDRIDFTIAKMAEREDQPRAVYLTRTDMAQFENEVDAPIGGVREWKGISIRETKGTSPSTIYSTQGLKFALRKRIDA